MSSYRYFQGLRPELIRAAAYLFDVAAYNNLNPKVTSVRRSRAQQTVLYERYLRGEQPYPVAPPGRSAHERGEAFDMVADDLASLGALWQQMGGVWGGERDPVHFGI